MVVNLYAKFEVSSSNRSPRYGGVPKFQKYPLWPTFEFLSLVPHMVNIYVELEVSSFNRSRVMEGVPKF